MKKIALIYDFLKELGGLERVMFFQANKLSKIHDPTLVFSHVQKDQVKKLAEELELKKGSKIKSLNSSKNETLNLTKAFLFPSLAKNHQTDLIISHSFMAHRMAHMKKKKDRTPYIAYLYHPPNFLYPTVGGWINNSSRFFAALLNLFLGPYLRRVDKKAVRNADLVISISDYTAKRVKEIYGRDSEIIYPQISDFFQIISDKKRKEFLRKKGIKRKFFLSHGRVIPDKDYDFLLEVMKENKDADLLITGSVSKDYRKILENKIKSYNLQDRVKILGRISAEDLLGYYNTAEAFLMSSRKEDFGLTIVEALACGCPIIAWDDKAGPSEIIQHKKGGLLTKPYDKKSYIENTRQILKKKPSKRTIRSTAKKFTEKEVEKKFLKLVNKILSKVE